MKAHPLSVRLLLAAASAVLGVCAFSPGASASIKDSTVGTPLPSGWELCILQGVGAPATQANVSDLAEWQLAEGGSTNNSAAYNPFNTARTTNVDNIPLPLTISANGFPAFRDWIAGCAATVATILQPNMAPVAAGLLAGNVSPPPAYLAVVDQSPWCAPGPDGTPCYADMIGGTTGSLAKAVLSASSALNVYGNVRSDLHSYQDAVTTDAAAQQAVLTTNQQLSAAESVLTKAREHAAGVQAELRRFAVDEYVSSGLYQSPSLLGGSNTGSSGTPSQNGVVAQQYATVVATDLLAQSQAATAAVKAAQQQRNGLQKTLQQDEMTLTSDNNAESRSLVRLVGDVTTLQKAGACTTAVITTPTPAPTPTPTPAAPAGPAPATSPGALTTPSTTTTTVAPTTTTTSSTTTTTTSSTTTTTTTPGGVSLPSPVGTTTTVPESTTTTSTSTTTTTAPAGSGPATSTAPPPTANPGGLQVLQGCVTALAPSTSA